MYNIGDKVCLTIDKKAIGIIIEIISSENSVARYKVFHNAAHIATYFANQLLPVSNETVRAMTPLSNFLGKYAAKKMNINSASTMFSLNAGKIKFIPFQFRPLTRILNAERPRLLIADEVGVGKTIETGLILKEFEKRNSVKSIIIICPKDLTSKWYREMKSKFDETFEVLSSDRLKYCLDELEIEGVWPYECQKCIIGLEMLRREENITRLASLEDIASFDMLIVDEAHHVINRHSKSHQIVEYFCASCDIAVFLSATPLQLGSKDLFSLLNLLLPDEFMDETIFAAMAEPNQYINAAIRSVRNISAPDWQLHAAEMLKKVCLNDWAAKTFTNNSLLLYWTERLENSASPISDEERIVCLRDLESLHTFAHVINRTKRKDIGEFTIREPITILTEYNAAEQSFYNAASSFKYTMLEKRYGARTANLIMSTIERQLTSSLPAFVALLDRFIKKGLLSLSEISDDTDWEDDALDLNHTYFNSWTTHLKTLAAQLPKTDSKAQKLLSIIHETIHNTDTGKLLVFSFFKHTLRYLHSIITDTGTRVEIITGDTPMEERDKLRHRFRLSKESPDAIDVLLCSEVGCEGLDYEFCSRMVNYDIPWNPMKIEQRIGRIDRFGQKSPKVQIYNFITAGTIEEKIFYRCYSRLGIFNATIGDLEGILGDLATELNLTAFDMNLTAEQQAARTQQLVDNAIRLSAEQRKFESDSRNLFLMDIETTEAEVTNARISQIQWQKHLVRTFLKQEYPNSICTDITDSQLKLRMFKQEKQTMLSRLAELKRKHKLDRNNQQIIALETYLLSDTQSTTLCFDHTLQNDIDQSLFISAAHPFVTIPLNERTFDDDIMFTSCETEDRSILSKGKYLFACYEWKEYGYRRSNDIQVLLLALDSSCPTMLSLTDFEQILLHAKESAPISAPDISLLDSHIYQYQQTAKARLFRINEDIITRKRSTLSKYFSQQIEKIQSSLKKSEDEQIRRMHQSRLQKMNLAWQEKESALNDRLRAEILVDLFAFGIIEVK